MLSRSAEGMFWLGRYMERADNVARFLEAGRRFEATGGSQDVQSNEWAAILTAAGCAGSYPGPLGRADAIKTVQHMVLDPSNPSSIYSCFAQARANGRAQRGSLTADMWDSVNTAWRDIQRLNDMDCAPRYLTSTLERVHQFTGLFRGAVEATMLRDDRHKFLNMGKFLERADATARLVDVKYHVLLPSDHDVGSGRDQLQWNSLLRALGSRSAYRWLYGKPVEHRLVIDLLLLQESSPRSFRACTDRVFGHLTALHQSGSMGTTSLPAIAKLVSLSRETSVEEIIEHGLHEYLTMLIEGCNELALCIAADFGFAPILSSQEQTLSQ